MSSRRNSRGLLGRGLKIRNSRLLGIWATGEFFVSVAGIEHGGYDKGLGMTAQEVEVFLGGVRAEIRGRERGRMVHCYAPITFVYGRKPEGVDGA